MTYKKLFCKKHNQHLFYVYFNTETGQIGTICQVCEDEAITEARNKEISQEMRVMQAEAEMEMKV